MKTICLLWRAWHGIPTGGANKVASRVPFVVTYCLQNSWLAPYSLMCGYRDGIRHVIFIVTTPVLYGAIDPGRRWCTQRRIGMVCCCKRGYDAAPGPSCSRLSTAQVYIRPAADLPIASICLHHIYTSWISYDCHIVSYVVEPTDTIGFFSIRFLYRLKLHDWRGAR